METCHSLRVNMRLRIDQHERFPPQMSRFFVFSQLDYLSWSSGPVTISCYVCFYKSVILIYFSMNSQSLSKKKLYIDN